MEDSIRPEQKYKVGAVCASVWKRTQQNANGQPFEVRKVVLDRTYRDAQGNWASTGSLDVNDVPKAILALTKAYEYMTDSGGRNAEPMSVQVREEVVQ